MRTQKSSQSWSSGGTEHILPNERKKATFNVEKITNILDGGKDNTKRKKFILSPGKNRVIGDDKYHMTRGQLMERHFKDFIGMHKKFTSKAYTPSTGEVIWMSENAMNTGSLMPHFGLFLPTIVGQGSMQQVMWWAIRAMNFQIVGSYAQTELGHGSNVRGLQTTAEYDPKTCEFVLNTPTLQSMKWWNSNLGCAATHATVYAQLIIKGKPYGVHVFMLQVRDENHNTLPGIECGDVGPKMGDHAIDTGYMRLKNVRIPREHMLCKRQVVKKDGTYVKFSKKKADKNDKKHYATMMNARAGMIHISSGKLAIAVTIAVRYSAVRHQGFVDTGRSASYLSPERPILDYKMQQYRILKQLAIAYALKFTGLWMTERFRQVMSVTSGAKALDDLPEIHATSAGLKGLCSKLAADGMEDCRKCCGGHGYLLTSGVAAAAQDYVWQVTAEGDFIVMLLQTARYLMKALDKAKKGEELSGLTEALSVLRDPKFDPLLQGAPPKAKSIQEFLSIDHLLALFRYRALVAVVSAGEQLKELISQGIEYDDAWNSCSITLVNTAQSYCFYFMLTKFYIAINENEMVQKDPAVKNVLTQLCALFACCNILDGQQWIGLLNSQQMKFVNQGISHLLNELRPNAVSLVDAFNIPDRVLNSSIGRFDGNVYEALYASAKKSELNQESHFPGYEEYLKPHLDLPLLALRNKPIPPKMNDMKTIAKFMKKISKSPVSNL